MTLTNSCALFLLSQLCNHGLLILPVVFGPDSENLGSHHRLALFGVSLARAPVRGRCNGVAESILLQVYCLIFDTSDSFLHQNLLPPHHGHSPNFVFAYTMYMHVYIPDGITAAGFVGPSFCQALLLELIHCFSHYQNKCFAIGEKIVYRYRA